MDIDEPNILEEDADEKHPDQSWECHHLEDPAAKVGTNAEDGYVEQLTSWGRVGAQDGIDDTPGEESQQQESKHPGDVPEEWIKVLEWYVKLSIIG